MHTWLIYEIWCYRKEDIRRKQEFRRQQRRIIEENMVQEAEKAKEKKREVERDRKLQEQYVAMMETRERERSEALEKIHEQQTMKLGSIGQSVEEKKQQVRDPVVV